MLFKLVDTRHMLVTLGFWSSTHCPANLGVVPPHDLSPSLPACWLLRPSWLRVLMPWQPKKEGCNTCWLEPVCNSFDFLCGLRSLISTRPLPIGNWSSGVHILRSNCACWVASSHSCTSTLQASSPACWRECLRSSCAAARSVLEGSQVPHLRLFRALAPAAKIPVPTSHLQRSSSRNEGQRDRNKKDGAPPAHEPTSTRAKLGSLKETRAEP